MRVYIDGACSGNPGPGGYAAVAMDNNQFTLICFGRADHTTNSRMELTAAIAALKYINTHFPSKKVVVYSDSQYVVNCAIGKHKRLKNLDLWLQFDKHNSPNVKWEWVRGHSGHKGNMLADKYARIAITHTPVSSSEKSLSQQL